jgi:hypothetical protein
MKWGKKIVYVTWRGFFTKTLQFWINSYNSIKIAVCVVLHYADENAIFLNDNFFILCIKMIQMSKYNDK